MRPVYLIMLGDFHTDFADLFRYRWPANFLFFATLLLSVKFLKQPARIPAVTTVTGAGPLLLNICGK